MLWCRTAPTGDSTAAVARRGMAGARPPSHRGHARLRQEVAAAAKASKLPMTMPLRQVRPPSMKVDVVEITGEMATSSTQATAHPQPTAKRISQLS